MIPIEIFNRIKTVLPIKNIPLSLLVIALVQTVYIEKTWAEGSADYYPTGATGDRGSMRGNVTVNTASTGTAAININGNDDALIKVYARPGEIINVGSSAVGTGNGDIYLMKPDGTFAPFNNGTSTSCASLPGDTGIIENRTEELAGVGAGGYTPCTYTVGAAEEGIFYVFYHEARGGGGPENLTANFNWSKANNHQDNDQWTTAWDVTVTAAGNPQTGRAYVNEYQGGVSGRDPWTPTYFVQTRDGIQYEVENLGLRGIYFGMFVNNKGARDGAGNPIYRSITQGSDNVHNPEALDTASDVTQKVFFNQIDASLPDTTVSPRGDEWLNTQPAEIMTVSFAGIEGTPGIMGVGMGGIFTINATGPGLPYEVNIDGNNDGDLNDPEDIILTGITTGTSTDVLWDGMGISAYPPAGVISGIQVLGRAGEVHFPFTDVEGNDGLEIKRLNGVGATPGAPDCTVYWDDTNFPTTRNGGNGISDDNNTLDGTAGLDSCSTSTVANTCNGAPYNGLSNYDSKHFWCPDWGNRLFADTWAFAPPSRFELSILAREADLVLASKTVSNAMPNPGDNISFTFTAINNGPDDTTNVLISDSLDSTYLSNVVFDSCMPSGGAVCGAPVISGNDFSMLIPTMPNGGEITIMLSADTASGNIAITNVTNIASILRSTDINDPEATNPDSALPASAQAECEAAQSKGATTLGYPACNNANIVTFQLPVTLSSVSSERIGDKVSFNWGTSSELFNVGFQLWGLDGADSKWQKLHGWLIRSGSGNAVEAQSYAKTVRVPGSINDLIAVGISSVDSDGSEHYYGPFEVGQSYGNLSTLKPIAWDHVRAQVDAQMSARGYVKDRVLGYRKVAAATAANADTQSVVEVSVSESGLYRITAPQLLNAGVDWASIAKRDIAVLDHRGNAVVRYVAATGSGNGASKLLGNRGELYFYADGVDNLSGLYTDSRVYRLVLDRQRALAAQFQGKRGISGGDSAHYLDTVVLERDNQYSLSSAADDPWLDTVILSHSDQPTSYAAALPVEADALWDVDAQLTLNLARSSALTAVDANADGIADSEHRVEAVVLSDNGVGGLVSLGRDDAVGAGSWTPQFTIPGGTPLTLIDGKAVVGGLFNAGAGYRLSEVHVDSVELSYARPYTARADDDYLAFTAPDDGALAYSVTVPEKGWPLVFAQSNGALVRLGLESQQKQTDQSGKAQRQVRFAALDGAAISPEPIEYWVSGKGGLLSPNRLSVKSIVSPTALLSQASGADLLLVAHPVFMTSALSDYAAFKRRQGFTVAIINYLDVVDAYGGGQAGPNGLTQYLNTVKTQSSALSHVLLIGGSSYDHTDKLNTGAMTFIPGHYGTSAYSNYTVTDTPYVSDANNTLFASIGRWPVRTESDLNTIIANSMTWSNSDHGQGSILAIAEHTVAGENINFAAALDDVLTQLPADWSSNSVHVDAIRANNPSLTLAQALVQAKTQLIDGLEAGPDVVLYNGHGTTSQLSNKGLFKASDVAGVNGTGAQLWVPMSCYMTYFESTHVNTLAHQLLFSGKAVGISGAMLLSNQSQNIDTGKALLNSTIEQGTTIGEAITTHKQAQSNPGLNTNLSHLGDPTLRM